VPSPQNREEVLFAAALEMPSDKRDAFLKGACLGDEALRQRLELLLAAHNKPRPSLPSDAPAVKATINLDVAEAEDEAVGKTIGRYKVLEKVGEGGCGVVYVAEQTEPVRRRVALKVIKLGMDTKQVVARFEAERQALAMMDHPNIAKVLDAGATENGRPYFVMELVRGITDHRILRPSQPHHQGTARPVHQGLPGDPTRPSEGNHPPRHQAVQHPRDAA
jgi:hypothetical protein